MIDDLLLIRYELMACAGISVVLFLYAFFHPRKTRLTLLPRRQTYGMRNFLQVSMLLEEQGIDLYRRLKERTESDAVKHICQFLLEHAHDHRMSMEHLLHRWRTDPIDPDSLRFFRSRLQDAYTFYRKPRHSASERQILRYALEHEKDKLFFYKNFLQTVDNEWKMEKVSSVIHSKRLHVSRLHRLIKNPEHIKETALIADKEI